MLPLYKRESDWMSIQPLEVPDRYIRVFPAKLLGGGRESYWQTRSGEGGRWSEKKSPDLRSLEVDISAV